MQRDRIDFQNTDVGKLFRRFLIPTVTGMVFSAVFVITDGIFVGRGIGSDALASVNLVAPLFTLGTGLGLMFGMGGSVVASINLAQGKRRAAQLNITQSLVIPALLITLLTLLLVACRNPVLTILGTPEELIEPVQEYFTWFTLFLAPLAIFNILTFIVRLDGAPKLAMTCNIVAAGINIMLDYLFIFELGWGLTGAAIATGIGYIIGSLMMLWYMLRRARTIRLVRLKLSRKSLLLSTRNLGYMSYIGFPALLSELAISCLMIVGNYVFIHYIGKDGVAAYSLACYIFPIIFMVYNGIIQAAQPIISYNYGAHEFQRGRRAFRLAVRTAFGCGIFFFGFTWLFNSQIVGLFLRADTPAYDIALQGLTWFAAGYPFFGINVVIIGYYQSIERGRLATGLTVVRGIGLMALCFVVMPHLAGTAGIWLAVPVAELLTTLLLVVMIRTRRYSTA